MTYNGSAIVNLDNHQCEAENSILLLLFLHTAIHEPRKQIALACTRTSSFLKDDEAL